MERQIRVRYWDKRINMGILGFCIVDTWKLYKAGMGFQNGLSQAHFYEKWTEELIDNSFDQPARRSSPPEEPEEVSPSSGRRTHLTPTKRRPSMNGELTFHTVQGRCRVCTKYKSSYICSSCRYRRGFERFFCHTRTGRDCYEVHLSLEH